MTKKLISAALAAAATLACTGCSDISRGIAGKTYVYEKDGFGGEFGIKLNDDGTFSYYEGMFSSYVGHGNWRVEGGELVLSDDDHDFVNHFKINGGDLLFIADGSDNFMHVKAKDGDRFLAIKD